MDFEEWFKKRHTKTGLYEKSMCGDDDSLYLKHEMKKAFEAGQQSKQAEIGSLKSKVQELWTELDDRQSKEHIIEKCESIIKELLK